jgi:hypothetical protein
MKPRSADRPGRRSTKADGEKKLLPIETKEDSRSNLNDLLFSKVSVPSFTD